MLTGATAWHALAVTGAADGDTVLVHGGAGAVGVMAIQLAADRGARVVATASPANHDLLHELGAVPVSYGNGLAERVRAAAPQGVDAALDTVGTDEAIDVSLELVADRSRIVTIAAFARGLELGIKVIGGHQAPTRHRDPAGRPPGTGAARPGQASPGDRQPDVPAHRGRGGAPGGHDGHTRGKIALTVLAGGGQGRRGARGPQIDRGGHAPERPACAPRPRGGTSPMRRPLAGALGPGSLAGKRRPP